MAQPISPDRLRRTLDAGTFASVYYIAGEEPILKDEAVAAILDRTLDPGLRDFNLDILSAQRLDPDELAGACATLPMMAERRVVVLRDVEAWKRKSKAKQGAVSYLQRPSPDTILVIVQGDDDDVDADLARHCTEVNCKPLEGDALEAWLDARLDAAGVTVAPRGRQHLLDATDGDLGLLTAEVEKLRGLIGDGPIDLATVESLVGVKFGETAHEWCEAIFRDDTARAPALLPRILETSGNSGVSMVMLLGKSLLAMRWARAVHDERRVSGNALAAQVAELGRSMWLKLGNTFGRVAAEVVDNWTDQRLRDAITAALTADIALKKTTISDATGVLTDLTLALATSRARRAA